MVKEWPEVIAVAKNNAAGESLPEQHRPEAMRIDHILHAPPSAHTQYKVKTHASVGAKPKNLKARIPKPLIEGKKSNSMLVGMT